MTIREITALRKSGNLQQALEAAERELTQNANIYTAGALFWCLNDLYKQQNSNDAASTVVRMKALYDTHCTGDEVMQKALVSAERRSLPHSQEIKDALENAKSGADVISVHRQATIWYKEGQLDSRLYSDFGWLTYYALKQTDLSESQKRKLLLNQYLRLDLPKPSYLHSLILVEAIKTEQTTPLQFRIRDFIRIWGLENLRKEDWEPYHTEGGNTLPSSVEKLIGVYAKELKTDGVESSEEFSQLVDKALIRYPNNQNMPYYKATVLISQGKVQEALAYYRDLILQSPSKFYLWSQSAKLVEDVEAKIGLLCKALTCGTDDEFLGGVRLRLASLLAHEGMKGNAKYELKKYRETYENKGWNLSSEFKQLYDELEQIRPSVDNNMIYAEYAVKADEFIYSSLPIAVAVKVAETQKDDRNHPGRKITTWILRTDRDTIRVRKPAKFRLNRRTPNGTIFDVKLQNGKVVWIKEHIGVIQEPWLKEISGTVHLRKDKNGKMYAIIDHSYVGENLLNGIEEGQTLNLLSIRQDDGRWLAIRIIES